MGEPGLMDDDRLPLTSPVGQFDLTDPMAIFFKNLMHPKHVVDLTLNNKEDDGGDGNATETASRVSTNSPQTPPFPLQHAQTGDDPATSSTVVTPSRKTYPWKNVQPWSPLYEKLRRDPTSYLYDPTVDGLPAGGSDKPSLTIAESSEHTLVPMTASASSLPNLDKDGPTIIDISTFTITKILDKRLSSSGIEYECGIKPLWLVADSVVKAQMGRDHIRAHENGLIREGRLRTLRERKRKSSEISAG